MHYIIEHRAEGGQVAHLIESDSKARFFTSGKANSTSEFTECGEAEAKAVARARGFLYLHEIGNPRRIVKEA